MNSVEVQPMGRDRLDEKVLWERMVHFRARDLVQPTPGRQQQAGKEAYRVAFTRGSENVGASSERLVRDLVVSIATFFARAPRHVLFRANDESFVGHFCTSRETTVRTQPLEYSFVDAWLAPIVRLEKHGHIDSALDVLYDRIDALLRNKDFGAVDRILGEVNAEALSVDVILGLLTATYPAKSKLPSRATFFNEAEALIKKRGEWEDGLLAGLEP